MGGVNVIRWVKWGGGSRARTRLRSRLRSGVYLD